MYLKKENLQSVKDLLLLARLQVEGFLQSLHQSVYTGSGQEFSQYRAYQIGDDLRQLDWKMYARSNRFYVKEATQERNLNIHFLVDATASMKHQENDISKFDFLRFLIASLAYLANQQGDTISLSTISNSQHTQHFLPKDAHKQLPYLLHQLLKIEATGKWGLSTPIKLNPRQATLFILVSDFHEEAEEIQKSLHKLNLSKTEILLFHLLTDNELNFNYKATTLFEDLESKEKVPVNVQQYRPHYLEKVNAHLDMLKSLFQSKGMSYQIVNTNESLNNQLRLFLQRRKRLI